MPDDKTNKPNQIQPPANAPAGNTQENPGPGWPYAVFAGVWISAIILALVLPRFFNTSEAHIERWILVSMLPFFAAIIWKI